MSVACGIRRLAARDDGAAALMVAASLLLLLGIAAIVVDGGLGFNERRQDQSAADVAALAAVQFATPDPSCGSSSACIASAVNNGAAEAVAVANGSLDDPTQADWTDPTRCSIPPAGYPRVAPGTACVAFTENLEKAWVSIPIIEVDTSFGAVLGVDTLRTSAQAEAQTIVDSGSILPFLLPNNAADTEYNCLKTSGTPDWGECEDLPSTGNFGSMDLFLYGNRPMGTTIACTGDTNGRLLTNLARGVDHPMRGYVPPGAGVDDQGHCPIFSAEPNMALGQPGVGSNLDPGLTHGGSVHSTTGPYPGRLSWGSNRIVVRGPQGSNPETQIDDTPLWDYLLSFPAGHPCASVADVTSMRACLASWSITDGVLFDDDIEYAVRFGFVPQMWEDDFGTPGTMYHIQTFRPVYLDTTMYNCSALTCDIVHTPGVTGPASCLSQPVTTCGVPGSGNDSLQAVTAFILEAGMMPEGARYPYPGDPNQLKYQLTR